MRKMATESDTDQLKQPQSSSSDTSEYVLTEDDEFRLSPATPTGSLPPLIPHRFQWHWPSIVQFSLYHVLGLYGLIFYLPIVPLRMVLYVNLLTVLSAIGVHAGAHRYWTHHSYRANMGVRLFLWACFAHAGQGDLRFWVRNHRAHHRWAETDADPHNSRRGFWFAHIGWLLMRRHPEFVRKAKTIDMSDLDADPLARLLRRHLLVIGFFWWAVVPSTFAHYVVGVSWRHAIVLSVFTRWCWWSHMTYLSNSAGHLYGPSPYHRRVSAREATVRYLLFGDGTHNYHHTFPWDYSSSELGIRHLFNPASAVIDFFAAMGWVWDRKKVTPELINKRKELSGEPKFRYPTDACWAIKDWILGLIALTLPIWIAVALRAIRYLFLY